MTTPRIQTLDKTLLIGMCATMTLADDGTFELWRGFKSRLGELHHRANEDFVSMRIYHKPFPDMFGHSEPYEKWAAVAVSNQDHVPAGMQSYVIDGGAYAVFTHTGPASTFGQTMQHIFTQWLPLSEYTLDAREHFEILPKDYDPHSPNAQEDVWVPIK